MRFPVCARSVDSGSEDSFECLPAGSFGFPLHTVGVRQSSHEHLLGTPRSGRFCGDRPVLTQCDCTHSVGRSVPLSEFRISILSRFESRPPALPCFSSQDLSNRLVVHDARPCEQNVRNPVKDHHMSVLSTNRKRRAHSLTMCVALACCVSTLHGCIDSLAMMSKVLIGDPIQASGFEMATGVDLREKHSRILIHCTSPTYVTSDYDSLNADIQEEVIRRMKRRGLAVLGADAATDILDDRGGTFDPLLLAQEIDDVDYIALITVESFEYLVEQSNDYYRGQTSGHVVIYEVNRELDSPQALKVYDQEFHTLFPAAHPVPADDTSKNVFIRMFIDEIADDLGHTFYRVNQSDLFAR